MRRKTGSSKPAATWVAGVDGCRGGWFVILRDVTHRRFRYRRVDHFKDLLLLPEAPVAIAVDIPIGLLSAAEYGGRLCDREARKLLGWPRRNSVFSPPVYAALSCNSYATAKKMNRRSSKYGMGISQQCYGLLDKLREVHSVMKPSLQERIFEVHPEVCFMKAAGRSMKNRKKHSSGYLERKGFLNDFLEVIQELENTSVPNVGRDDVLDACVACWTATRFYRHEAEPILSNRPRCNRGLKMEIWF